jgi:surfeit locus 1 family protein
MAPGAARFAPPAAVVGVLRAAGGRPLLGPAESAVQDGGVRVFRLIDRVSLASLAAQNGLKRPAPYLLAAEAEAPQPTGVTPAALPQDIPNNHFVYAMTWFALAAVLVCIYVAMLPRRLKAR